MLPWWATALLTFLAKVVNQFVDKRKAEAAMRDLGAATQAAISKAEAERQEAAAKAAAGKVTQDPEDPADPFLRKD